MSQKRRQGLRWLIHAANGWGLGHVARTLALARQIRARSPDSEFLFFTNSEASNLIWREGFASVKVPSLQAVNHGLIDGYFALLLGRVTAATVYAAFRPDVVISDTFPLGGNSELPPLLHGLAQRVLICHEIPKEIRENPAVHDLFRMYQLIIVPHWPGEVDLPLPKDVTSKETGYMMIRSRDEALPRAEARRRLGLPADGFFVYVAFGGGGDNMYREFLRIMLAKAREFPDWELVCVVPPLLRDPIPQELASQLHMIQYFPLAEVWNAFDGAITLMGANTWAELLHNGIPTVFLPPRTGLLDDQVARAERMMKAGAGAVLRSFERADLDAAFALLADPNWRATTSANGQKMVSRNGAETAADFLLDYLSKIESPGRDASRRN